LILLPVVLFIGFIYLVYVQPFSSIAILKYTSKSAVKNSISLLKTEKVICLEETSSSFGQSSIKPISLPFFKETEPLLFLVPSFARSCKQFSG
jgi:hypothetical protein